MYWRILVYTKIIERDGICFPEEQLWWGSYGIGIKFQGKKKKKKTLIGLILG